MQASNQQQQKQSVAKKQTVQTSSDTQALNVCPHCGEKLEDGADFCGECGKPVSEAAIAKAQTMAKAVPVAVPVQPETIIKAKPEPVADDDVYDPDDYYEPVDNPIVIEEEPVRKSFFSNNQMASIRQTGADIDETNRQRAEAAQKAARIAEQKRREEEQRRQEAARIAEEKRQAQIAEQRRQEAAAQQAAAQAAEQRRREAERQAEAQRIAAEQRQKAAAQQAAAQQAAQRAAEEAERQRQIREAQAQKEALQKKQEQDRTAALTSAQVRQQTLAVPTDPFSIIGAWTGVAFGVKKHGKVINTTSSGEHFQFKEGGKLICIEYPDTKNSWIQNGNSVTLKLKNNSMTEELKIINSNLMQGTGKDKKGYNWSVEYRRE